MFRASERDVVSRQCFYALGLWAAVRESLTSAVWLHVELFIQTTRGSALKSLKGAVRLLDSSQTLALGLKKTTNKQSSRSTRSA